MNKLVLSMLALLSLQQLNIAAAQQDRLKSAKAYIATGKTYLKKYGPGALKIAAGLIWLKSVGVPLKKARFTAEGRNGINYPVVLELRDSGRKAEIEIYQNTTDNHIRDLRLKLDPASRILSKLPFISQMSLIAWGAYDIYQASQQR